jgi:hypothetical protein
VFLNMDAVVQLKNLVAKARAAKMPLRAAA